MRFERIDRRTIWVEDGKVLVIDQRRLPHALVIAPLPDSATAVTAIRDMWVRGAPLIGATAAYGVALAMQGDPSAATLARACELLAATRPTAVNLAWGLARMRKVLEAEAPPSRREAAWATAAAVADESMAECRQNGEHGVGLIAARASGRPVEVLTHCNAGWLATVNHGTALAPVYAAHDRGIPVHVWVTETRPRNQGAALTAWELAKHGVPHTVVVDSAAGHLCQQGRVDLCIVGSDRTARNGDVCNKIGTYMDALSAKASGVPFFVALPSSTLDFSLPDGSAIPIEERDPREVSEVTGLAADGSLATVRVTPAGSPAANWGFDVTPASLVSGLITPRGVCAATREGLASRYPERA